LLISGTTVMQEAEVAGERHLGHRHCGSAIRAIMYRANQPLSGKPPRKLTQPSLDREVDGRGRSLAPVMDMAEPERLTDMPDSVPDEDQRLAGVSKCDADALAPVLQQPYPTDRRRGQDGAPAACRLALIVERHVAAHDREVERAAGVAHAFEAADDLGHDLGPLRIGEVEAVGDRQRGAPTADRLR
jgi:hypothetical protein